MDFDWIDANIDFKKLDLSPKEIEESFEDPFAIRLLPDSDDDAEARYFSLGRSVTNRSVFSLFWTDGKKYRVIAARPMTPEEEAFYERKNAEFQ